MVEQGRPDEEAALQVRIAFRQPKGQVVAGAVAAVNDQLGTGGHTLADVVAHPRQRRPGDQRAVVRLGSRLCPTRKLLIRSISLARNRSAV